MEGGGVEGIQDLAFRELASGLRLWWSLGVKVRV